MKFEFSQEKPMCDSGNWLNFVDLRCVAKNKAADSEGCVGFVDGNGIFIFHRPVFDSKVFWDRNKHYYIKFQICDLNCYINSFIT